MKRWRGFGQLATGAKSSGYTIAEVMIVLAVSTALFVVVAATFQGRQARNEFTQAVRNYEAKLQSIVTDVVNGVYQTSNCAIAASGVPDLSATTNSGGCIFLGKVLQPSWSDGTAPHSEIYTLIGRRTAGSPPQDITTLQEAAGIAMPSAEAYTHTYGLKITRILSLADTAVEVEAVGFINSLSGGVGVANNRGDTRQPLLYGLIGASTLPQPITDGGAFQPLPEGVLICLVGQNGQYAEFRLGAANSQTMIFSELDTKPSAGGCPDAS